MPHKRFRRISKRKFALFLRFRPTKHEKIMWEAIQAGLAGTGFLRQVPIKGWIADFLSKEARLILEIDGKGHYTPKHLLKDKIRDSVLAKTGFRTLRFKNEEVEFELEMVLEVVREVVSERLKLFESLPEPARAFPKRWRRRRRRFKVTQSGP